MGRGGFRGRLDLARHRSRLADARVGRGAFFRPHDPARSVNARICTALRAWKAVHRIDVGDAKELAKFDRLRDQFTAGRKGLERYIERGRPRG